MIDPVLVIGIVIACTVWYMRHRWRKRAERVELCRTTGRELLARRYARGDIEREEHLVKRDDILGYPPAVPAASEGHPVP